MTTDGDDDALSRLRRLLGGPDTVWLVQRMRTRLASRGELTGTITKPNASMAERTAAARLVGRPVRAGHSASVSMDVLDEALRRSVWPEGLTSAVVALTGEVVGPDVRRAEREGWQHAGDRLRALGAEHPDVTGWAEAVIRSGGLKRLASAPDEAEARVAALARIAGALPVAGESLGVFAARVLGDAHALDAKASLGPIAAGMAAALGGLESEATPGSARWRREAWMSVGVVLDELSSTVLALGLPGGRGSPTATSLHALASSGQPAILSLRQVLTDDIGAVPALVSVCENPAVVAAAADRLGAGSAPLVCVSGQPGAAVLRLLAALADGGAELRYHGDFDAGGMAIARSLAAHVPWTPWRFGSRDYTEACSRFRNLGRFSGEPGETAWDPSLSDAMGSAGARVEEELVLGPLLADLAEGGT